MKRALLIGVPDVGRPHGLRPAPSLATMTALLEELGGWEITKLFGRATEREPVLEALQSMVAACEPHDTCLFYFFGHGGVVRFSPLAGDLGTRPVFYLATLRPPGRPIVGILDVELSRALTRLDEICGNVTAILDCCHAASILRDGAIPVVAPPPWVTAEAEREPVRDRLLAVESHPRIVRLFGASSLRTAYPEHRADGECGLLTKHLVAVLREAELRCDRLTWDAVAHRVREQASLARGTEEQRVVLAGPRQRLVLSPHAVALPRSAAYLPSGEARGGWLRAGLLQGVEVGDRWSITGLTLDDELEPQVVAEAEVRRVELDRCEVTLRSSPPRALPPGSSALLQHVQRRVPVAVEAPVSVVRAVEASGLLRAVPLDAPAVIARVTTSPRLQVTDEHGRVLWPSVSTDEQGSRALVELLEDRARAHRLLTSLVANDATAARGTALQWRWGRIGPREELVELGSESTEPADTPRLHANDRIWIELGHRRVPPPPWFVSVIEIGVDGRPNLLNTHEPEGIEVAPGFTAYVGLRGSTRRQGLPLTWPSGVPQQGPRPSCLIVIASTRPIALGHLVHTPHPDDEAALHAQGLRTGGHTSSRGSAPTPPLAARAWTWGRIDFLLDPRCR